MTDVYETDPCVRCGLTHLARRCTAHARDDDGALRPCTRWPVRGLNVCPAHGGRARQSKAKAVQNLSEKAATLAIRRVLHNPDARPVTDPVAALQRLTGQLRDAVESIGERVNELESVRYEGAGAAGSEQLRGEVAVWTGLMRELRGALTDLARLGLEERQVRVDEATAARLNEGVDWLLRALGVTVTDAVSGRVEAMFRALADGTPLMIESEVAR